MDQNGYARVATWERANTAANDKRLKANSMRVTTLAHLLTEKSQLQQHVVSNQSPPKLRKRRILLEFGNYFVQLSTSAGLGIMRARVDRRTQDAANALEYNDKSKQNTPHKTKRNKVDALLHLYPGIVRRKQGRHDLRRRHPRWKVVRVLVTLNVATHVPNLCRGLRCRSRMTKLVSLELCGYSSNLFSVG